MSDLKEKLLSLLLENNKEYDNIKIAISNKNEKERLLEILNTLDRLLDNINLLIKYLNEENFSNLSSSRF